MAAPALLVACGNGVINHDTPGLAPDERPSPAATLTCDEAPTVIRDAAWLKRSVVVGHVVFPGARAFADQPTAAFWPIDRVLRMRIHDERASRREREGSKKLLATVKPQSYGIAELHIAVRPHHRVRHRRSRTRPRVRLARLYTARSRPRRRAVVLQGSRR